MSSRITNSSQERVQDAVQGNGRSNAGRLFPLVGIGAYSDGLQALTELLKHLPLDTGMGFVLVQHPDPEHESALTPILSRATRLPVQEVTKSQLVEANHVYVIPPDVILRIEAGVLKRQPRPKTLIPFRPIDTFFESLAQERREACIGVVLSGTANDGTLGLEAVKAEGGITFAQDDSAKLPSRPRNVVAAGCVDLILSPAQIAQEIGRISKHPYWGAAIELSTNRGSNYSEVTVREDDQLSPPSSGHGTPRIEMSGPKAAPYTKDCYQEILLLLRNHSGVDFSFYTSATIQSRVIRRLVLSKYDALEDYARFLRDNANELDALYSEMLTSVTSFFRSPEVFATFQNRVLPRLLKQPGDDPLRCWVLGCSTGQEAYSLAMAFVEVAEKTSCGRKLQIFASDLNEVLLEEARHGLYAQSVAMDLPPRRLRRFFVEEEGGYRVSKALRDMVVFARQNLITDPPFSRLDLISGRDLLISLEPSLQTKALATLHYALKPGGVLLLDASESIGGFTELFKPVGKKYKIYVMRNKAQEFHPSSVGRSTQPMRAGMSGTSEIPPGGRSAEREADRITIERFAPPGVLVNADLQIIQFRGPTDAYLEAPAGKPSCDVLRMVREGLMLPLRAAINQAKKSNKTARRENVRLKQNGKPLRVNLEVIPLRNLHERGFLVLFEDARKAPRAAGRSAAAGGEPATSAREEDARIATLEAELTEMREYLQSVQEQHVTVNEELQTANEEVQSSNEELRSINVELETSKEELVSANEDLIAINDEMANRNLELSQLNNDFLNLQTSTRLALILLGRDLSLRQFSTQAATQFELLATDIGRHINDIRHSFVLVSPTGEESTLELEGLCKEVINTVREEEREVRDKNGRWYSLRARPYMTLDSKVEGAVLVLIDIDYLKRSESAITSARDYAENIVMTVREPLLVLDKELRVESANGAFYSTFHVKPAETIGRFIHELGNGQWGMPRLRQLLEEMKSHSDSIDEFLVEHDFEGLGRRIMLLNARNIHGAEKRSERILLAIDDVTDRVTAQEELRQSETRYRTLFNSIDEAFCVIDVLFDHHGIAADYRFVEVNPAFEKQAGLHAAPGRRIRELAPDYEAHWLETFGKVAVTGKPMRFVADSQALGGRWFDVYAFRIGGKNSRTVAAIFTNITERRKADETIRINDEQLRQHAADLVEADRHKNEFLAMLAHELRNPLAPISNSLRILRMAKGDRQTIGVVTEIMERQVRHLVRLVDDLLDVNRISQGKIELRRERVGLARVVADAVQLARPLAERMEQDLVVTLPPEPVYFNADPNRLAQVLANLLNNAVKFTKKGGRIELTVECTVGRAAIRVRDNGIGIAADQLPLIFGMFMQINTSLERSVSGLGIGLTLVKRLVEMHGGTVDAHSEGLGHGSEFVIHLPVVHQNPELMLSKPIEDIPVAISAQCALVIDDNGDSAASLASLLELSGIRTLIANDGVEAMKVAEGSRPDLILLDIGIPKLNGYEVAQRIRAQPWGRSMVLIALTGWGQDEYRKQSLESGFDGHMVKPFNLNALATLLADLKTARRDTRVRTNDIADA